MMLLFSHDSAIGWEEVLGVTNRLPFSAPPWLSASAGSPDSRVLGDARLI